MRQALPESDARPTLLVGDLNMRPGPAHRVTGLHSLVSGPTFPADAPREQIDHVLGTPGLEGRGRVVRLPMSDHRAVVVDLQEPF
jgi:endonuclease/exonuclease/phosphatase family metal-dependent hydrolase